MKLAAGGPKLPSPASAAAPTTSSRVPLTFGLSSTVSWSLTFEDTRMDAAYRQHISTNFLFLTICISTMLLILFGIMQVPSFVMYSSHLSSW
jgi:hypothetical protein